MEPTLDNRMILGGMGNLRLAPHVREGRGVAPGRVVSAEPRLPAAADGSSGPVADGERVSISAEARAAFEQALGRVAGSGARARAEATAQARERTTGVVARSASAVAAYAESAGPVRGQTPRSPVPGADVRASLPRGGLYA